jgi:hypothetical protein
VACVPEDYKGSKGVAQVNREPKTPLDWVQWWFEVWLFSTVISVIGVTIVRIVC